eukprot:TRINITY_DN1356_c0_g1_i11.p1 TRINITY_DN1356_c0_g1~~TRINITY_DN1356_c0_g1_i11.p1  ORF type:complete len:184 (-),score=23.73 TRINITY_DN1356_c0_g1_i11:133-627(-)
MAAQDILFIVSLSFLGSLISECLSWLFIYSQPHYEKLKATAAKQENRVKSPSKGKKGQDNLQNINQQLGWIKMKSDLFIFTSIVIVLLSVLSSLFDGEVVAKLPFQPFSLISGITHRGLPGNDLTDCSYIFIYVLSSISFRSNLQKIFGTNHKNAQLFGGMKLS